MYIMFFLNHTEKYLGSALAAALKKYYGVEKISVYTPTYDIKKFLTQQRDIEYANIFCAEDEDDLTFGPNSLEQNVDLHFLREMEDKYGIPNLWLLVEADRDITAKYAQKTPSFKENLRFLQTAFRQALTITKKFKPDCIVFCCIANMFYYISHVVAKKEGIPSFQFHVANLGYSSRTILGEGASWVLPKRTLSLFDDLKADDYLPPDVRSIKTLLHQYRSSHRSDRLEYKSSISKSLRRIALTLFRNTTGFGKANAYQWTSLKSTRQVVKEELVRRIRPWLLNRSRIYSDPDYSEDYVYFPLHLEPEMATMVQAPFFVDQQYLIESIAKSLPIGYKLYVKEHPGMYNRSGFRPIAYYRRILVHPNVTLIRPEVPSFGLIKNARLVITITGTAGMEALVLKKPVILFGDIHYRELDLAICCREISKLPHIIRKTLSTHSHDERQLLQYLYALHETSTDVDYVQLSTMKPPAKNRLLSPFEDHPDFKKLVKYVHSVISSSCMRRLQSNPARVPM
jgi:hypothetical protein